MTVFTVQTVLPRVGSEQGVVSAGRSVNPHFILDVACRGDATSYGGVPVM